MKRNRCSNEKPMHQSPSKRKSTEFLEPPTKMVNQGAQRRNTSAGSATEKYIPPNIAAASGKVGMEKDKTVRERERAVSLEVEKDILKKMAKWSSEEKPVSSKTSTGEVRCEKNSKNNSTVGKNVCVKMGTTSSKNPGGVETRSGKLKYKESSKSETNTVEEIGKNAVINVATIEKPGSPKTSHPIGNKESSESAKSMVEKAKKSATNVTTIASENPGSLAGCEKHSINEKSEVVGMTNKATISEKPGSSKRSGQVGEKKKKSTVLKSTEYKRNFDIDEVSEVISNVLQQQLEDKTYDSKQIEKWSQSIVDKVKVRLLRMGMDCYKLICQVVIGENRNVHIKVNSGCFWDVTNDYRITQKFENKTIFSFVVVFATRQYDKR